MPRGAVEHASARRSTARRRAGIARSAGSGRRCAPRPGTVPCERAAPRPWARRCARPGVGGRSRRAESNAARRARPSRGRTRSRPARTRDRPRSRARPGSAKGPRSSARRDRRSASSDRDFRGWSRRQSRPVRERRRPRTSPQRSCARSSRRRPPDRRRAGRSTCAGAGPREIVAPRIATIRRTTGFCIRMRASSVTSRALETWPGASSPSGRTKCVSSRPSRRARRFIMRTKRSTSPCPTCSASAHAASFALWISAASIRSRTESRSPARSGMLDSPTAAACGEIVTMSSRRACSSVTSTVIIFVRLAIGTRLAGLFARSTSPVRPSSTMYARALTSGRAARAGGTSASAAAMESSQSFNGRKATGGSERTANDEHGRRHEQEEGDRKGVPPRLRAPVEVPHQPEAVQTSLFRRAASCAAAERQSSSVVLNA